MSGHRAGPPESSLRNSILARRQNRNVIGYSTLGALERGFGPGGLGQVVDIESGLLRR
jgi:hypothetical protein